MPPFPDPMLQPLATIDSGAADTNSVDDATTLTVTVLTADGEVDDDGFTNLRKFIGGSDPQDANSTPNTSMPWLPLLPE